MTVSPEAGARLVEAIRSIIKLPTTRILGFFSIRKSPSLIEMMMEILYKIFLVDAIEK